MIPNKEWLVNYKSETPSPVKTSGKMLESIGTDSVILNIKRQRQIVEVTINNILHVPGLNANLISVKYLAHKLGITTEFHKSHCKLIKKKRTILATGSAL